MASSRHRLSHLLKRLLRTERPFPVRGRGISLYALWDSHLVLPEPPAEFSKDIGVLMDDIGLWMTVQLTWRPASDSADTPEMTASEAEWAVIKLRNRLNELYPSPAPAYLIFHINEVSAPKPRLYFFYKFRKKAKTSVDQHILAVREDFVEGIQRLCELGPRQMTNDWLPNRFRHYDQESQRRGWLVISPTRALLVAVNEEQTRILANILQPYDTDSNRGPGILSERYREVLTRVSQWNSNQDSFEAVDQLKDLVESGTKAIDGQVLLNFAVAGIGILIAFLLISGQTYQAQLTASVGCLGVASLWFWLYARNGRLVYQLIGWVCVLTIIPCFLAWPGLVSLYQAVVKFFSHL